MRRNRFVKVTRHLKPGDGSPGDSYYSPVELRNGNLYQLCSDTEFDHTHGIAQVEDAWHVIDAIENNDG